MSEPKFFEIMGGEEGIERLVDRFYDEMDRNPEARDIRIQHPADLAGSREKLRLFLIGWTGGPQLYMEKFGHPRLRARHLPFQIGVRERDQWLMCFRTALGETNWPDELKTQLDRAISRLADHMRNRPEAD